MGTPGQRDNQWTDDELSVLRKRYPSYAKSSVTSALSGRSWSSIQAKAKRLGILRSVSTETRFWDKVDKSSSTTGECDTPCWLWLGKISPQGYAHFHYDDSVSCAHRYSFELNRGPIPDGMEVHHVCYNRACVNPNHLEIMTHEDNVRDAARKITQCPYGHEYTDENTKIYKDSRRCRECHRRCQRNLVRDRTSHNDHDFMEPDHVARFLRNHNTGVTNKGRMALGDFIQRTFQFSSKPPRVLDVACGTCVNYETFRGMGVNCLYEGIDRTPKLIAHAKRLYGDEIKVHRGYAQDLPFVNDSFDVIILRHIAEHMHPVDFAAAVDEAVRVSDKEVLIVFFEPPTGEPEHIIEERSSGIPGRSEVTHYWNRYSHRRLMEHLMSYGHKVSKAQPIFTPGAAHADVVYRISKV